MSKRTRNVLSYEEAVVDIIEWVDNEGDVRGRDRRATKCPKASKIT